MTVGTGPAAAAAEARSSRPGTSLVICTRNRPALLAETVTSILEGSELPSELVIIDQSDPPNPSLAGLTSVRCQVRHIVSGSVGLSRARNEGLAAARQDLLVFTDDDVVVDREWFATLVQAALREGAGTVITGQVLPSAEGRTGGFVPSVKVDPTPAVFTGRIGADVIYPHNMAIHRATAEAVGPFDPLLGAGGRFPAAEDNDYCHRLLEAGFTILYLPDAVIHHRAWRSRQDYLPLRWAYGRGQGAYYAKYLSLRDRYMLRRLSSETLTRLVRMVRRWRTPLGVAGEAVYLSGLLAGAAEWSLTQRGGPRS